MNVVHDAKRLAEWLMANDRIDTVGMDLSMEFKQRKSSSLELAAILDEETGFGLRFLINGAANESSIKKCLEVLPADRITFTDAHAIATRPTLGIPKGVFFDSVVDDQEIRIRAAAKALAQKPNEMDVGLPGVIRAFRGSGQARIPGKEKTLRGP